MSECLYGLKILRPNYNTVRPKEMTRRLFINASWLLGGKTASSVFSAVQTVVVARMLGVSEYGLLALIIAYVDILNQLFDFRVWETATKYIGTFWTSGEKEKTRSMIKLSYIVDISSGIVAFLIAIATAGIASRYLISSPQAQMLICIYALSLLIDTANSTSDAILRVFDRFKTIAFIASLNNLIRLIMVSTALYLGMGIKGVLLSYIAASFVGFTLRLFAVAKTLKDSGIERWWNARLGLIRQHWRGIAWFLGNTSLTGTLKMANDNYLGTLVLGYFAGKEAVAYYKVAKSVVKLINRITDPIYEAIYPELVKLFSLGAIEDIKRLLKESTKNLGKIIVPIAAFIFILSYHILYFVFGAKYTPSSIALKLITIATLISLLTFWINPAFLAIEKVGLRNVIAIGSTLTYILLLLPLAIKYSYIGAAIAFLGYNLTNSLLSLFIIRRSFRRNPKRVKLKLS
ncbi:Inner membrane protein YghQ [bacterium HR37]|nr:Inner membrane protein YghQ [bacterium HR37]